MAQLRQPPADSEGRLPAHCALTWQDFVNHVLEVTVTAYQAMYRDRVAQAEWEENVFTIRLGDYIRILTFDLHSPLRVVVRPKTHTADMAVGRQATIQAAEIDMLLFDAWGEREYHRTNFVWEAKRVADKRINATCSKLNSEYVNEAIYRFIRKDYADGLDDAGVLAYVLAGDPSDIVNDVNRTMKTIRKNPPLPESARMHLAEPIAGYRDIFRSKHRRIDDTPITLHHLFLRFFDV